MAREKFIVISSGARVTGSCSTHGSQSFGHMSLDLHTSFSPLAALQLLQPLLQHACNTGI
jgi:hypothetical protein